LKLCTNFSRIGLSRAPYAVGSGPKSFKRSNFARSFSQSLCSPRLARRQFRPAS
jgi:hypothetical protein